ncbi:MAG: hypothetical protein KIS86_04325 [Devosia sp.]|nr:hypothetical protein [Devosia sp.]
MKFMPSTMDLVSEVPFPPHEIAGKLMPNQGGDKACKQKFLQGLTTMLTGAQKLL